MKKAFGIDLGTTYSCIAWINDFGLPEVIKNSNGDNTTPSVIHFESETNVVVGAEAKENAVLHPTTTIEKIKSHMGKQGFSFSFGVKDYSPEVISSYILKKLAKDAGELTGQEVKDVVITVPAYFGEAEKQATINAGTIAGLNVLRTINEPTAAAIAFHKAVKVDGNKTVMVYDLGGGTFDVTIIDIDPFKEPTVTVRCSGGNDLLGGKDWDKAIIEFVITTVSQEKGISIDEMNSDLTLLQDLSGRSERAKRTLSNPNKEKCTVTVPYKGNNYPVELSRQKFEELTESLLDSTMAITDDIVENQFKKAHPSGKIDMIILVGGSTRMPQVKRKLKEKYNIDIREYDPDEAVAKGAAIIAEEAIKNIGATSQTSKTSSTHKLSPQKYVDVTNKSYALKCNDENDVEILSNIILKNTTIPCSERKKFSVASNNQASINFCIYQNEFLDDTVELYQGTEIYSISKSIPAGAMAGDGVVVEFNVNESGMFKMVATLEKNGFVCEGEADLANALTKEQVETLKSENDDKSIF